MPTTKLAWFSLQRYVVVVVVVVVVDVVVVVVAYRIMVGCCRSEDELPFDDGKLIKV